MYIESEELKHVETKMYEFVEAVEQYLWGMMSEEEREDEETIKSYNETCEKLRKEVKMQYDKLRSAEAIMYMMIELRCEADDLIAMFKNEHGEGVH